MASPGAFLLLVACCGLLVGGAEATAPPAGSCNYIAGGGVSKIHEYVCCNNVGQADASCDGTTYQGGSTDANCGPGGENHNGYVVHTFTSPGCAKQNDCQTHCNSCNEDHPGLCWDWAICHTNCVHDGSTGCAVEPSTLEKFCPAAPGVVLPAVCETYFDYVQTHSGTNSGLDDAANPDEAPLDSVGGVGGLVGIVVGIVAVVAAVATVAVVLTKKKQKSSSRAGKAEKFIGVSADGGEHDEDHHHQGGVTVVTTATTAE